jgi:hypothetical protein
LRVEILVAVLDLFGNCQEDVVGTNEVMRMVDVLFYLLETVRLPSSVIECAVTNLCVLFGVSNRDDIAFL